MFNNSEATNKYAEIDKNGCANLKQNTHYNKTF